MQVLIVVLKQKIKASFIEFFLFLNSFIDMKKYIIPIIIGAIIGALLSSVFGYLISFEIMIKSIMQSSNTFKVFSGAVFGAFCAWVIVYNKEK